LGKGKEGGREGGREGRTVHTLGGLLERGDDTAVLASGHLEHQGGCWERDGDNDEERKGRFKRMMETFS